MKRRPYQSVDESHKEQPDIQLLTQKLGIGRHDLIFIATQVARIEKISPKESLIKLEEIENLEEYLISLKFKEAEG
tara:strand:+ start:298 stop:525 length:228 start_codon:yes stop_codon:yes gene_type:complete